MSFNFLECWIQGFKTECIIFYLILFSVLFWNSSMILCISAVHFLLLIWDICRWWTTVDTLEEELTPRWICFFYFNLCFSLLLFIKKILSIYNGQPWGTLPLCLNIKPKYLCPPVDGYRKEEINTSPSQDWPFQEIFARLMAFLLYFLISPHLCSIKEPVIQILIGWLFWDISLPSSWSAGFPNEVVFQASTPCL